MKRYCISPIIGLGTAIDSYRAAVSDVAPTVAVIPVGVDGRPLYRFCLCLVSTSRLSDVIRITNTYVFPDYVLDGKMEGMEGMARAAMVQSVGAYRLDDNGKRIDVNHRDTDGFRDLMNNLGRQFDSVFNVDVFDVSEV